MIEEIKAAIDNRKETLADIATATGINRWWIKAFRQGRIKEPGFSKIEKLRSYLLKKAA